MTVKSIRSFVIPMITSLLLIVMSSFQVSVQNPEDKILGNWYCEELENSYIRVNIENNGTFSGTITQSSKAKYIGKKAMKDVKYNSKERKWEGTIISVKRNKEINAEFTLENENTLKVVGSVFLFTKTFYWERK